MKTVITTQWGIHQQINREAYRLLTETKQTGLIKSESHTAHGSMTAKPRDGFLTDQQRFCSCCCFTKHNSLESFLSVL